jgi:hypothetical protein
VQIVIVILAFALLAVVLALVSAPLRADRRGEAGTQAGESARRPAEIAELEAARESKYREIRDAELDLHTGKLSRADYDAVAGALRAEALAILDRLQELERADPPAGDAPSGEQGGG